MPKSSRAILQPTERSCSMIAPALLKLLMSDVSVISSVRAVGGSTGMFEGVQEETEWEHWVVQRVA